MRILEVYLKNEVDNKTVKEKVERNRTVVDFSKQRKLKLLRHIWRIMNERRTTTKVSDASNG